MRSYETWMRRYETWAKRREEVRKAEEEARRAETAALEAHEAFQKNFGHPMDWKNMREEYSVTAAEKCDTPVRATCDGRTCVEQSKEKLMWENW